MITAATAIGAMLCLLVPAAVIVGLILDRCLEDDTHPGFADMNDTEQVPA